MVGRLLSLLLLLAGLRACLVGWLVGLLVAVIVAAMLSIATLRTLELGLCACLRARSLAHNYNHTSMQPYKHTIILQLQL